MYIVSGEFFLESFNTFEEAATFLEDHYEYDSYLGIVETWKVTEVDKRAYSYKIELLQYSTDEAIEDEWAHTWNQVDKLKAMLLYKHKDDPNDSYYINVWAEREIEVEIKFEYIR